MTIKIYHNPHCSKSRLALKLLQDNDWAPIIVEYLKQPPSKTDLNNMLEMLGMEPRDLMRKGEAVYKELKLDDPSLTREQLIDAMVSHPILLERPIVISGTRAAVGRPPEKVLDIIE